MPVAPRVIGIIGDRSQLDHAGSRVSANNKVSAIARTQLGSPTVQQNIPCFGHHVGSVDYHSEGCYDPTNAPGKGWKLLGKRPPTIIKYPGRRLSKAGVEDISFNGKYLVADRIGIPVRLCNRVVIET